MPPSEVTDLGQNGARPLDAVSSPSGSRVVLSDGRVALLRELRPDDQAGVLRLHQQLEQRDQYFRFFGPLPPKAAQLVARMTAPVDTQHGSVGVFLDAVPLGVANYETLGDPTVAEIALVVSGATQAHGIGTLVLEHLVSIARRHGVRRFVAEVLSENGRMLRLFRASGLPCRMRPEGSVTNVAIVLDETEPYLVAMGERERVAEVANLRALLRPRSVVVVGAGPGPSSLGHAVLGNLVTGGYTGELYAVTPHIENVAGAVAVATIGDLPVGCDLAVLCVPAADLPEVARQCGRQGVRALVVISARDPQLLDALLAPIRRYGMRMVGPNSLGVANNDLAVRLDATAGPAPTRAGSIGLVTQAGGTGIALREQLNEVGLGLSAMVSTGDKLDVSGNDLLMWWRHDDATTAVVLCLESFGNPRKFARLCQALARTKPVLALRTGTTTPSADTPTASTRTRDVLFRQAGVIAVDTETELTGILAALSWQPLPSGNRVAVLTSAGVAGISDTDAWAHAGVVAAELNDATTTTLRTVLGKSASVANPVQTAASVDGESFAGCTAALLADPGVDAVITSTMRTTGGDPITTLMKTAPGTKPVLAVRLDQSAAVAGLPGADGVACTASFADPVAALCVLGRLAAYAQWRTRLEPPAARPSDVDAPRALGIVREHFRVEPTGGWLGPLETFALLSCFGIPVVEPPFTIDQDPAAAPTPMLPPGRRLQVRVSRDGDFGPLIEFGLSGVDTELGARIAPLTNADADDLLLGLRCSPALFGPNAALRLDMAAVRDVLVRVSRLAQLLPEVTDLALDPMVLRSEGCLLLDARARAVPSIAPDPFLPALRN